MKAEQLSFLTPYLSGAKIMEIHLASIRSFHPNAPILISKSQGESAEMDKLKEKFDIQYWLEDLSYNDALLRLLQRCQTEYVCILDHDTVLLSSITPFIDNIARGAYELVGIEERIRVPDRIWKELWPKSGGWLRFCPGYMDATFLVFNLQNFIKKWGINGIKKRTLVKFGQSFETHYGICDKLREHHYLRPYHSAKYGLGNLIKSGDTPVLWHQWYGAYRSRLIGHALDRPNPHSPSDSILEAVRKPASIPMTRIAFVGIQEPSKTTVLDRLLRTVVEASENAFIADYPALDIAALVPAWAPNCNIFIEKLVLFFKSFTQIPAELQRWKSYGLKGCFIRLKDRL